MGGLTDTLEQHPVLVVLALLLTIVVIVGMVLGRRLVLDLGKIHLELAPNGGTSLRDAIDRIERKADTALKQIGELRSRVDDTPRGAD